MGRILVLVAAVLWAASGTIAQYLFSTTDILPKELTVARMLMSGAILLASALVFKTKKPTQPRTAKDFFVRLPLFGIVGIYLMQYTYFESIYWGNAAAATVLQYNSPIIIIIAVSIMNRKLPNITEFIATIAAVLGVFLLVSGGDTTRLLIPVEAVGWGIISAFSLAFYTVYPTTLLKKFSSNMLLGAGMMIGGIVSFIFLPNIDWHIFFMPESIWLVGFIVIFGTVVPFFSYLRALEMLPPTTVGIIACVEPFAAVVFAVVFLNMTFGFMEILGVAFVVGAIALLSLSKEPRH